VVTIPFAITLFWLIRRSKVVLYEDRLVVRWMETCELVYGNIESLRWEGKNVVGTLVSTDSKDEPPSLSKLFDVSEEKVGGQFFRKRFEYKLKDQEEWRELALRNYENPAVILGALIEGANLHLVEPEAS
jgi:hypothetical protein